MPCDSWGRVDGFAELSMGWGQGTDWRCLVSEKPVVPAVALVLLWPGSP